MGVSRENYEDNCIALHVEGIQKHLEKLLRSLNKNLAGIINCNINIDEIEIKVVGDRFTVNVKNYDMKKWQDMENIIMI